MSKLALTHLAHQCFPSNSGIFMNFTLSFYNDHRDPFDRMLIAQAFAAEDLAIASSDQRFAEYKGLEVIRD